MSLSREKALENGITIDFFSENKKCILEPFVLEQIEIIENILP
jgi:hypothetical protein